MSYLNPTFTTVPTDQEAAALGASRIRALATAVDTVVSQIFNSSGAFMPSWITGAGTILGNPTAIDMFSSGAVGTADIAVAAITEQLLAPGALGADAYGRAAMANGFLLPTHLASGFEMPTNTVPGLAIQPSGVQIALQNGVNVVGIGVLTAAMMVSSIAQAVIGQYAGSASASAIISGLSFTPNVVILFPGTGLQGFGISLLQEVSGSASNIHASWVSGSIVSPDTAAVQWSSNGFTVVPSGFYFNAAGQTHTYIALLL